MIVDASAVVAILLEEPEAQAILRLLAAAPQAVMSAATVTEVYVVLLRRKREDLLDDFRQLMKDFVIAIAPHGADHAERCLHAYRTFGQGSGHPARLNFGDCVTYALAAERDEPILCKGEDFVHTDRQVVRA